jgi:hypothetical protein
MLLNTPRHKPSKSLYLLLCILVVCIFVTLFLIRVIDVCLKLIGHRGLWNKEGTELTLFMKGRSRE